jgi:two-component system cell cycle response regulator DivK
LISLEMTVLLADDDRDTREMYGSYLERAGVDVITVTDGKHAIAEAKAHHPDVIVMDMSMPGMDGFTAARRLKASPETADIPVLALTGAMAVREAAREAGCDGYLAKPCLPDLLLWEVRALFVTPLDLTAPRA